MGVDEPDDPEAEALCEAWEIESEYSLDSLRPPKPRVSASASTRPGPPGGFPTLPKEGEQVAGFRLIAELGRGAFARVFLAEEANLGGRHVALKVSAAVGNEPTLLARLQHAHIVPVHSVRDDPRTGLRLLCMPFLGGANLAQVMDEARAARGRDAAGLGVVEALDLLGRRLPSSAPGVPSIGLRGARRPGPSPHPRARDGLSLRLDRPTVADAATATAQGRRAVDRPSRRFAPLRWMLHHEADERPAPEGDGPEDELLPSRRFLRGADAVRAAVWIVARLAEGLDHAHSRGLLHRDLKPSNVLIAADGTPMLLDFNLAVDSADHALADQSVARALLGGTLPYMAPEHLDALDPRGTTRPDEVDERSDLYSLGLILFELIAGGPAFGPPSTLGGPLATLRRMVVERRAGAPSLRSRVPEVPPSLDALAAKCLHPDPARRYRSAADFAEDLRRFLDDLPMKHGPEPSLAERARKWSRRHPAVSSSTWTAAAFGLLLVAVVLGAMQAYEAMQGLQARLMFRAFERDYLECRFLLNTFGDDDERLRRGLDLASQTLRSAGVDRSGGSTDVDWLGRLEPEEREEVRQAVVDLILEDAQARVALASRRGGDAGRRDALERAVSRLDRIQDAAEPPPAVLFRRRAEYREALGDARGAEADRAEAAARPPTTCHDWTSLGLYLLSNDDVAGAERALTRALALDVTSFWAWFAVGHCHFEQGRFAEAAGDFTACVVARPEFAWSHFNRGLALAHAGRPQEAVDAYSQAIAIDPEFVEARINRGLAHLELGRDSEAEADLRSGVGPSQQDPRVLVALGDALARQGRRDEAERLFAELLDRSPADADVRAARGLVRLESNPEGAADDFRAALSSQPRHALAHYGMARVLRTRDAGAALDHLDRALAAAPSLFEAVELRALERARRGDRAALDDVERLVAAPTANRLYNAACALAMLGHVGGDPADLQRAADLLGRAVRAGFPASRAVDDPDLAPLRGRSDFAAAIAGSDAAR